jgi:hypothetical protein
VRVRLHSTRSLPFLTVLSAAVAVSSCGRGPDRAANDSTVRRDSLRADTTATVPTFREWLPAGGRYLLVAASAVDTAFVVFPEFTTDSTIASAQFVLSGDALTDYDLWAADGSSTVARLTSVVQAKQPGCEHWPLARLQTGTESRSWTIGLRAGRVRGIAYNTIDRMTGNDSVNVVVDLARLASQAPNDTSVALRGLPYVVRTAYRATLGDSLALVVGEVVRRVNIEANPREERTTIIGERAASDTGPYTLVYSERLHGDEEGVPTTELIGLVQLNDGNYVAFGARDYSDGGTYLMFAREKGDRWRMRWQSAYAGC